MRRSAPPPGLRVAREHIGPWTRVDGDIRGGVRFAEAPAPGGRPVAPADPARPLAGSPTAVAEAALVAGGQMVLAAAPGVAYSLRAPQMHVVHDRRPPGLSRVVGAAEANAGLLRDDAGWRVVVLPSLGDVMTDLGPGPVAIRHDGRRVAVAVAGGVEEGDLPDGAGRVRHDGDFPAICYGADGRLLAARGAAVGRPVDAEAPGAPVVALAAAARASTALAAHDDGTVSVWSFDDDVVRRSADWAAPLQGELVVGLSPDGTLVGVASPAAATPAVAVARAADGALMRHVTGARAIALGEDGGFALGGDFGLVWFTAIEESE